MSDASYYNYVSDGVQRFCEVCETMPCVVDAAICSSFDTGKWTEENLAY